jgi:hypothetical protein
MGRGLDARADVIHCRAMFIGHFAAGFAAKKFTPYTSLGTLMLSVQLLDLIWPTFLWLGVERVRIDPGNTAMTPLAFEYYPWTHSLAMSLAWAVSFGGIYAFFRRYQRGALVVAIGVFSHWVLDFVTHRADLPIAPGLPIHVGLGLWNSVPATIVLEMAMFVSGLWLYARNTEPTDRLGTHALVAFSIAMPVTYAANIVGPPPPSAETLALVGHAQWLFIGWAMWLDRHRVAIRQWH